MLQKKIINKCVFAATFGWKTVCAAALFFLDPVTESELVTRMFYGDLLVGLFHCGVQSVKVRTLGPG